MSEEQLKAFFEAVKSDIAIQEQLSSAAGDDAVVEIAKTAGFTFSVEELKNARSEIKFLDDRDLENVAGGAKDYRCPYGYDSYLSCAPLR